MSISDYLGSCRELNELCTQNGWIDSDSLRYEVLERGDDGSLTAAVYFDEVIMEGSGCVADRIACYGRLRLRLNERGEVVDSAVI